MSQTLDPELAAALRGRLVALPRERRSPRPRTVAVVAGVAAALTAGSVTAFAALRPADQVADLPLAPPVILNGVGPADVPLPPAPAGATYLRIELACFEGTRCSTPGGGVGRDTPSDGGAVPAMVQRDALPLGDAADPGNAQRLEPVDPREGVAVDVDPGAHWRLYAVYVDRLDPRPAPLPDGRTAGLPGQQSPPDLVPAVTTDGRPGWVGYHQLLDEARPRLVAGGVARATLPVYAADGATVIGEADVSRSVP